jgi:uncharacterized membrane protein YhhN
VTPYAIAMAVLVGALLLALRRESKRTEWALKPAAAATFLAAAWSSGAPGSPYGWVLFAGLCLAALGDVLLIPRGRLAFLAGLTSFLLGHVLYAVAFWVRGVDLTWTIGALVALLAAAAPILRWLLPHVRGEMRAPVAAYVAVITMMVALAAGTVAARGEPAIALGAVGFYLSDLAVARDRFVRPGFVNRAWGLPLYFGSQLVLSSTVAAG